MRAFGSLNKTVLVAGVIVLAASCGTFGGEKSTAAPVAAPSAPVTNDGDREARLREAVDSYIQATSSSADASGKLIHKTPYYFKEYFNYTGTGATASVDIHETESRAVPYRAEAKIDKLRFATKLHRKRDEATADSNFLRDTGKETLTFEMRSGRWYRVGSLFVAEKTEENVNGEWVPAKEEVERTVAAEEENSQSWWQRAWNSVTGR